jgi:hypothetical protein
LRDIADKDMSASFRSDLVTEVRWKSGEQSNRDLLRFRIVTAADSG